MKRQLVARYLIWLGVALMVGLRPEVDRAEFRFDEREFRAALARGAGRSTLRGFYRRPDTVPVRAQSFAITTTMRELGEKLFFDTRLGAGGTMGCVTCHQPAKSFSDNKPRSSEISRRRSMTLHDLAWNSRFGWTGRINSLMSQALLAFEAPGGMNTPRTAIVAVLERDAEYPRAFRAAYGGRVTPGLELSFDSFAHALEVYVGSLVSPRSAFDRWVEGDEGALGEDAKRGFDLFNGRARCAECHMSWRFTDGATHDIGLNNDRGLAEFVKNDPTVEHHFKTPGLREVGKRPPYMHDGSLESLEAVIQFYNRGGNITRVGKSDKVGVLGLAPDEASDLRAFLDTLSASPH